jgi:hypothetical protein
MNINDIVMIHTFDDGNQRFRNYPNEWKVTDVRYNGGKLELVNNSDNEVLIYSISAWKVRLNIADSDSDSDYGTEADSDNGTEADTTNSDTTNSDTTNSDTTNSDHSTTSDTLTNSDTTTSN